jgi:UDP-N-acetylmuramoyl-tripeptide--D-alanyl-D-alanine ligase
MRFSVQELVTTMQGRLWNGQTMIPFPQSDIPQECSFSIDSRTIQSGQIFIALRGSNADGHNYLAQALEKGACGLIVSDLAKASMIETQNTKHKTRNLPFVIQVADTLQALHAIAHTCRQKHPIPLAGITGSNGKTTVKDMTAAILATRHQVLKSPKSLNNPIGLPVTLANMTTQHDMAVLEMGMNAPDEIRSLAAIARPDVGAITNIAPAHIGFFLSLEAIMRAKLELFETLPNQGTAVLNADDQFFEHMLAAAPCAVITFGARPVKPNYRYPHIFSAHPAITQDAKYTFDLHTPEGSIPICLPVPGYHNVLNALAATAISFALHLTDLEAIKAGLEHFQPSPMRMQVSTHHDITIINDAYNANPASMASALQTLRQFPCSGKKVAVLGDMFELGQLSQSAHYDVGKLAAAVPVNALFLLGEYAEYMAQGAQAQGMLKTAIVIGNSAAHLAQELAKSIQPHDLVLFKASRGMAIEKVIDAYLKMLNVEC